ncbi:bifunctional 2-C-methyl-D-erythritol 4-phosphate cytidylyltransferase/2-C-methyl-D-erythritol 2,4-cyclodiphosphate synthase [Mesorhizobium sp. CU2]|uniref:bifunctional 2-C-methyl-D-erythritol 4-phosphate cytidylyltransferase/2-C-methyl-D-erythritol 2,4-cyclodiphosphate synthase n=1 Tax=unclassified Mesorhizobium TaxID=325217 RepID=UPI00112A8D98|nr:MULTISPECIES: bifunctional 2-C-methyl-D-erythritol 4-phosphate cytidylyltransferase/2-C-methyl-D-erythritol 2,4-cyclodiphosphate synthase [unclassified Mesorhizobium]TPN86449.1 bifunctional 2-C-methyl-D-erythritol 4-phosphate cytidylyltransferase/2-C-methyl-D-erythritol 2,4-cyclodiphosphate synthase [Mesorhizobium sp. CU3]TPO19920.1 bifunctional 2-C-methyl-D-erythritol 4-phosphate cytidylyltransferase/2-C-methyl-D-erythritol 2,4-cyclodiphosphate synthase [Mesorhizobium sp. CU2]
MSEASEKRAADPSGGIGVVIVAAGRGARAGQADGPKQYQRIGGRAVIAHTLDVFLSHPMIGPVVVAIHADDAELLQRAAGMHAGRLITVIGGASRQASVRLGLLALKEHAPGKVLVHDAVRPFVDATIIDRTIEAIDDRQGALPCLPVADTLKRESATGMIQETVPRAGLHAAQTPQGFPYRTLLAAHEKAHNLGREDFTDDAAIAEWAQIPVKIVPGSPDNVKLTWARDIALADQRLSSTQQRFPDIRTGNGYDVHAFEPGDHVTLCGVAIPYDRKLSGHSDADVGLHALTDALLATCGAGDIGTHFPPSDPQWKGAASKIFVEHAAKLVRERGGRIANADITLICEAPRVGPHRAAMTEALSAMLGIAPERISIKATTNEKLGFVGRGEGIAAIATASVVYPGDVPA